MSFETNAAGAGGLPGAFRPTEAGLAPAGAIEGAAEKLGPYFPLLLVYLFLEFGRPPNPLKLPLMISCVLVAGWLLLPVRKWNPQILCCFLFLGVQGLGIPFALNEYTAFWTTYNMIVNIVCITVPIAHFVNSPRKLRLYFTAFMLVFVYVALWAVTHAGFGPAGAGGGQDENYVGLSMLVALPVAYFSFFVTRGTPMKMVFAGMAAVYVAALVVGFSRGAFLGLCFVLFYLWVQSPQRWVGLVSLPVLLALGLAFVPQTYWDEMNTIQQIQEGTADTRIEFWKIGLAQYLDNPVAGVGPGNYSWNLGAYQSAEQLAKFERELTGSAVAHSLYIDLIAENGTAGALLFLMILYFNFRDLRFVERRAGELLRLEGDDEPDPALREELAQVRGYARALVGSTIGFLVASAFLSTLEFSYFWVLTGTSVAVREVAVARFDAWATAR